ncbi:MAG: DNA polymerase IV [Actinomycetales bacterium]
MTSPDLAAPDTRTPGRWVLHVDLDQFLVAVELLRRPELVGKAVVVGGRGDPTERAVVSTASYEARAYGVRSGVPLKVAVRRCPDAVFLPVDRPVYEAASARVMATLKAIPDAVVEVLGWDEAFVGITSDDPLSQARSIQAAVLTATGLHCSIGLGDTLVKAKIATDFGKPQGVYQLTDENWFAVMGEREVAALWGVGPRLRDRLKAIGVRTVAELAATPTAQLVAAFGPSAGGRLHELGRGGGRRWPDDTPWIARAHGHETTYQQDLTTSDDVRQALDVLARQVVGDLHAESRAATRVHLKARFRPFFTTTKVRKLQAPTFDPAVIAQTAYDLFLRLDDQRPVRLLGIRAEMEPPPGGYPSTRH